MTKALDEEEMYKDFSKLYDETKNYRKCEIFIDKIDPNMINKLDSNFSYSIIQVIKIDGLSIKWSDYINLCGSGIWNMSMCLSGNSNI